MTDTSFQTKARLTGAWRLQSIAHREGAAPVPAQGMIIYSESGHMSAQILSQGPEAAGEVEFHSYFGTYSLDAEISCVTHHREANSHAGAPADVVRRYRLVGDDTLVLRPDGHDGVELTFSRADRQDLYRAAR